MIQTSLLGLTLSHFHAYEQKNHIIMRKEHKGCLHMVLNRRLNCTRRKLPSGRQIIYEVFSYQFKKAVIKEVFTYWTVDFQNVITYRQQYVGHQM